MALSFRVTNQLPIPDNQVSHAVLDLFQDYTQTATNQVYDPFSHQAETFRLIENDKEVFLVAGTAAGKTLAIGVPLFDKLRQGRIQKILLMYPTIALMEDQRKVMDTLAELTNLDVGLIQGGMPRARLIAALTKPVILATPDAIFWFFRKNIKYSGLLIYGLAQVDEVVLDEAHLFNGLMLRNFEQLWLRIKGLAHLLERTPRLHILTATPTDTLQRLNQGERVDGKSKCQDVNVDFEACGQFDRRDRFFESVTRALDAGRCKILVVCNSARMAHQLFEEVKVKDTARIPVEHRLRFGVVNLGDLLHCLEQANIATDLIDEIRQKLYREEDVVLADVPANVTLALPLAEVLSAVTDILEGQSWRIKRALWEQQQQPGETLESLLRNAPLPCQIVAAARSDLAVATTLEAKQTIIEQWISVVLERFSEAPVNEKDEILCQSPDYKALAEAFVATGLGRALAEALVQRLRYQLKVDPACLPIRDTSHRQVYLRWLGWLIKDKEKTEIIRTALRDSVESGSLNVNCRHIGVWKKTDVPVIVYSGSMAKPAREGLIDVFSDLERAVLISTSAVEVGVDFHADMLITEQCEGNGFLQRFGRVGRHGNDSYVITLVDGDAYARLSALPDRTLTREAFSAAVTTIFPARNYAAASDYLDAGHYLVNEQLGRMGTRLNASVKPEVKALAEQLRAAGLQPGFGLRSTLPQMTLRDGVTKDPFYLLRYVDNDDLRAADSPFEVARAKKWFTELLYQKANFDIVVDLETTLDASRHVFIWTGENLAIWPPQPQPAAGKVYLSMMLQHFQQVGIAANQHQGSCLLLHGDIYLRRLERETRIPDPNVICDRYQNPVFIPAQTYLVLWNWTDEQEIRQRLTEAKIIDWEELYYDWGRLKSEWNPAMVLVEKSSGACFAAYKELVTYVSRKV